MTQPVRLTIALAVVFLAGCLDPIVGVECAAGFSRCGGVCVDLQASSDNCGACGQVCQGACTAGACVLVDQGGGSPEAVTQHDGGEATSDPVAGQAATKSADGATADDGTTFGAPSTGAPDAGQEDGLGEGARSGDGASTTPDTAPAEADGGSNGQPDAFQCGPDETICSRLCVYLDDDPDNCGACGVSCSSGLCSKGVCLSGVVGHVVVIGHDYVSSRSDMNNVVGNAVFLTARNPARVAAYEGTAASASVAGTNNAIDQVAAATGRRWIRNPVAAPDVPAALAGADVLLIHAQAGADDASLIALGRQWGDSLRSFVTSGGIVVLLDGFNQSNSGSYHLLEPSGLFSAQGRSNVTNQVLSVVDRGNSVALRLPTMYRAQSSSVDFDTPAQTMVVASSRNLPVVVHITF